jgi:hypothetical protein
MIAAQSFLEWAACIAATMKRGMLTVAVMAIFHAPFARRIEE